MIDKLITKFVIWWCKHRLNKLRLEHPNYTIFEIKGTGKDYPNYLMFTDVEHIRNEMMKI